MPRRENGCGILLVTRREVGHLDDVLNSSLFQGSGWLLTLLGCAFAFLAFWQVGRKNSAFRRALVATTRRDAHDQLVDLSRTLAELASHLLVARRSADRKSLVLKWRSAVGEATAAIEARSATDPLDPSANDYGAWATSSDGRKFGESVLRRRPEADRASKIESQAKAFCEKLRESDEAAEDWLTTPTEDVWRRFLATATGAAGKASYITSRSTSSRSSDLHDDR